jgi:serine/threonine-protein kinase HipA
MITSAFVNIWNKRVGAVAWDPNSNLGTFEYDKDFALTSIELAPILMPLSQSNRYFTFKENRNSSTFKGLPGLLADSLPDKYGNALINTWLTSQGRASDSLNPVETLCFIGERGMGALEFEPVEPKSRNSSSILEIGSLVELAEQILSGRKKFSTNISSDEEKALLDILKIGTSAGGARAKALVAFNKKTGEVRSGQTDAPEGFDQYLIKFDGVTDSQFGVSKGYGRVEMAYYLMAKAAGIEMNECRLLEENDRAHFMTKRFDRIQNNEKIHVQTFCAMRHFDFNEVNIFSYEQLFETMRLLGLTYPEAQELFRRMVFNVLSRNCDDHTKNFAFIMNKSGQWSLSPAYDVCHAYRPGSAWVSQHALSINGKRKDIRYDDFIQISKRMNIKNAKDIIDQVNDTVLMWEYFANQVSVDNLLLEAIKKTHLNITKPLW